MSLFQKIIQGSFNQAHPMFRESVGKQCTCCSLYAISFNIVKSPGHWNSRDLDFIVSNGDKLYKSLNKDTYLMIPDLPKHFFKFDESFQLKLNILNLNMVS